MTAWSVHASHHVGARDVRPAEVTIGHKVSVAGVGFYEDLSVKRRNSRRHLRVTSDRSTHGVRLRS